MERVDEYHASASRTIDVAMPLHVQMRVCTRAFISIGIVAIVFVVIVLQKSQESRCEKCVRERLAGGILETT